MLSVDTHNKASACHGWKVQSFLASGLGNVNTQSAYANIVTQLASWCENEANLEAPAYIDNELLYRYVSSLHSKYAVSSVRQHVSGLRRYFTWLCNKQFLSKNPAQFIPTPSIDYPEIYSTEVSNADVRVLLDSLLGDDLTSARDRAIIAFVVYTFSTTSIVSNCSREGYVKNEDGIHVNITNRRGDTVRIPAHAELVEYIKQYLDRSPSPISSETSLFLNTATSGESLHQGLNRTTIAKMVQRRAEQAGLPYPVTPQSLRARAIMNYMTNGGSVDKLRIITGIEKRSLKRYDSSVDSLRPEDIALVQF